MSHCSLHCVPTTQKPISKARCQPCCQGDEKQLLKDRDVTKQPNVLSHLSAPDDTWMKAGFRSTTSGNSSLPLAAAEAGSP